MSVDRKTFAESIVSNFFNSEKIPISQIQKEYLSELEVLLGSDKPLDIDSYCDFDRLISELALAEEIEAINAKYRPKNQELFLNG